MRIWIESKHAVVSPPANQRPSGKTKIRRTLSLCLRASAAGVGLSISTARTYPTPTNKVSKNVKASQFAADQRRLWNGLWREVVSTHHFRESGFYLV